MFRLPQGQEELVRRIREMDFDVRLALNRLAVGCRRRKRREFRNWPAVKAETAKFTLCRLALAPLIMVGQDQKNSKEVFKIYSQLELLRIQRS